MQVVLHRKLLLDALAAAADIVPAKADHPIQTHTLIQAEALDALRGRAVISGTNLQQCIVQEIQTTGMAEAGAVTVEPGPLRDLLKAGKGEAVTLRTRPDSTYTEIKIGNGTVYQLPGCDPTGFPKIHLPQGKEWRGIPALMFSELIDRVLICADKSDEKRPHLSCVLFDRIDKVDPANPEAPPKPKTTAAAIDGHRLGLAEARDDLGLGRLCISRKGIVQIQGFLDPMGQIQILREPPWLWMRYGGRMLGVREWPADQFPAYSELIRPAVHTAKLGRDDLCGALRRLMVISDKETPGVVLELRQNAATMRNGTGAIGEGREEFRCTYSGPDKVIGFSAKLLGEILDGFQCDQIAMELQAEDGEPVILKPDAPGAYYLAMLMVMRI